MTNNVKALLTNRIQCTQLSDEAAATETGLVECITYVKYLLLGKMCFKYTS